MKAFTILAIGLAAVLGSAAAHADQLSDIKARGTLVCGTLGTAEPFSFQDPKTRQIVGYDIDMCAKVADALGVKLEVKPMAVEARIPELLQGRVDILAANLGWTKERAQQIDYSYSYFVSQQKLLVAAESGISTLDQARRQEGQRHQGLLLGARRSPAHPHRPDRDVPGYLLRLPRRCPGQGRRLLRVRAGLGEAAQAGGGLHAHGHYREVASSSSPGDWESARAKRHSRTRSTRRSRRAGLSGEADKIFAKWFGPETIYGMKRDFKIEEIKE